MNSVRGVPDCHSRCAPGVMIDSSAGLPKEMARRLTGSPRPLWGSSRLPEGDPQIHRLVRSRFRGGVPKIPVHLSNYELYNKK